MLSNIHGRIAVKYLASETLSKNILIFVLIFVFFEIGSYIFQYLPVHYLVFFQKVRLKLVAEIHELLLLLKKRLFHLCRGGTGYKSLVHLILEVLHSPFVLASL